MTPKFMEKEDARKQSREVLHERRKQVIRLHRKGVGVMQIVEQTGLSWSPEFDTKRCKLLICLK